MLDMIAAGLTSVKTARDLTKGLRDLNESVAVQSKAAELLGVIGDVQASLIEAQQRIYELQESLREANEALKKRANFDRYSMVDGSSGVMVWRLRDDTRDPEEPIHYICPHCREDGTLSLLKRQIRYPDFMDCVRCKNSFRVTLKP